MTLCQSTISLKISRISYRSIFISILVLRIIRLIFISRSNRSLHARDTTHRHLESNRIRRD